MKLHDYKSDMPQLTLTTIDEIEVVSIIANSSNWVKYPNVLHPIKRKIRRSLARRAFDATSSANRDLLTFPLTVKETAIVAEGVSNIETALLDIDENVIYSTNTISRDVAALDLTQRLRK